jgi:hypothetical protein
MEISMASQHSKTYDQLEIQRAAYSMIDNHGRAAAQVAMKRARNLGDDSLDARKTWERIVSTICKMQGLPAGAGL